MIARLVASVLVLVATVQPAAARDIDPATLRPLLAGYGSCIVKREPVLARQYVLSGEFLDRRDDDDRRLLQRECLDAQKIQAAGMNFAVFSDAVRKGAIAQALFDRDAASLTATTFTAVPALTYAEPWAVRTTDREGSALPAEVIAKQQRRFEQKRGEVLRARLGECVVRTSGAEARAVLATPAQSPAELAALQALSPALSTCLPAGETVGFDRMTLRGALAVGYYRLASAAQNSGGAR